MTGRKLWNRNLCMKFFVVLVLSLSLGLNLLAKENDGINRYLYMSSPDGSQTQGRSEPGILIFDIDNDHRFVRRIDIPIFEEGLRGFTGSLINHCVYYSTTNRRLGSFDLETEKILWEKQYPRGCDRTSITMDGKKIYVPTGWWYKGEDSGFLVIDASNGELIKRIEVGLQAHNSIVSLDNRRVYLGTETMLTVFDTATDKIVQQIKNVGERGIFPYTIKSNQEIAYVCLGNHVGFDVVDLVHGKLLHRVLAGDAPIPNRTHGAGLTPDETELWISDQKGQKLFIFDSTKMPPTPKGHVELSVGGHGWVCFSLDGKYAWNHAPDIFDARTKEKIGMFKDASGKPVSSSKFIEIHFDESGKVVEMSNEFALGRK